MMDFRDADGTLCIAVLRRINQHCTNAAEARLCNRNEEAEGLPFHIGERTSTKAQGPRDDGTALLGGPATNPQRWGAAIPRPQHPSPGSNREA